ncbi:MAG: glycosyltransferase [Pirellulaceae bacterium]
MNVSIAICTWNRSRLLRQTLDHIVQMEIPQGIDWELVIVDNRSTDDTPDVIKSFSDRLPVKYVFEPEQGHSASRNRAIDEAAGDYILWTDNDVIVNRRWLAAYVEGFGRHPDAGYFGGKIIPVFESEKPEWLEETWNKCRAVFAWRDLGDEEMELPANVFPYGANFAIRADLQRRFRFDTAQGRKAQGMIGNDEIQVLRQIASTGFHGVWLPQASLQHYISDDRATPQFVQSYFVGQGHTNITEGKVRKSRSAAWREWLQNQVGFRFKRIHHPPEVWVSHLIRAGLSRGEYLALREAVPRPKNNPVANDSTTN